MGHSPIAAVRARAAKVAEATGQAVYTVATAAAANATDLVFIAGLVMAFVGLALWSLPLALVLGGLTLAGLAQKAHEPSGALSSPREPSGGDA